MRACPDPPGLLVFSDLDGTLLDHHDYSWAPAAPVLAQLRALGAGLVLASSKTAAEMAPLREAMGYGDWPAIVENGAGLLEAGESGTGDDAVYLRIRAALRDLPPGFRGFGDMTAEEIGARTGLDPAAARLAQTRRFSEPGLWTGPPEALTGFERAVTEAGMTLQRGGRFCTLSFGGSKADRMEMLIRRYAPRRTLALGDAPNDLEMLARADHAVIVTNSAGPGMPRLPGEAEGRVTRTRAEGPQGWAEAVSTLLDEYYPDKRPASHG